MQKIKNIIDRFPSKTIHGKHITFETRIFEIPEQGIEMKVFANNVFIIYYNIYILLYIIIYIKIKNMISM